VLEVRLPVCELSRCVCVAFFLIPGPQLIVMVLLPSSMPVIPFFGRSKNDILEEASSYFEEAAGQMTILRSENLWTLEQRRKLEDRLAEYVFSTYNIHNRIS
jgi:hypothetical protein